MRARYRLRVTTFMGMLCWGLISCGLAGCTDQVEQEGIPSEAEAGQASAAEADDPRRPRIGVVEALRADLEAERHASDGGGTATVDVLEPSDGLRAGGFARFRITFIVGADGIAVGGAIYLQASPFWGWSTPQVEKAETTGFTTVMTDAEGVVLEAETVDRQLLAIHVRQRAMISGDKVSITYGAGSAHARIDRFAESDERLWLAVDGDGDGVRRMIAQPPSVNVGPGSPGRVVAFLPSTARPNQSVQLHLSVLDRWGNAGVAFEGRFRVESQLGRSVEGEMVPADLGTVTIPWQTGDTGVYQLRVELDEAPGLTAETNPMSVAAAARPVFWGDLQIHSNRSDGTGLPSELYRYGRDVARLDVMSVTDHDHWGLSFLDQDPLGWQDLQDVTDSFHEPGRFVTVRGFEWTHWIHGHRHVLVFDELPLPIFSSIDSRYDHPTELWQALSGRDALTVAHHSAGGPIAVDWTIPPDPELEIVTEVVSVHGSSEAADSPRVIHQPVPGNFIREAALGRGYRLGFIGSTDGHDGHPGLAHLSSASGGLAAILAETLSREGILDALRHRRTYATSGPRIILRVLLAGHRMGADVIVSDGQVQPSQDVQRPSMHDEMLWVQVIAPGDLERVDVIRPGSVVSEPCSGRDHTFISTVGQLEAGEFLYVRAVQKDGHFALSSPFFFVEP